MCACPALRFLGIRSHRRCSLLCACIFVYPLVIGLPGSTLVGALCPAQWDTGVCFLPIPRARHSLRTLDTAECKNWRVYYRGRPRAGGWANMPRRCSDLVRLTRSEVELI